MRKRAVALFLVAAVLAGRPEQEHDPDDDAEERHDGAEDQDLRHGTIIVPGRRCGQTSVLQQGDPSAVAGVR